MNNEKIYTAADFASYHAGNMSAQDMHALEKAALEDPFLSDALDGYVHTNTAVADIESLKGKLLPEEKSEAKVLALSSNKNWMRAAASIAIVFGLGYLFYSVNKKDEIKPLAKNELQQEVKVDSIIVDANKTGEAEVAIPQMQETESQKIKSTTQVRTNFDTTVAEPINNNLTTTSDAITQQAPAVAPAAVNEAVSAEKEVAKSLRRDANTNALERQEVSKDLSANSRLQNNALNYYNYSGVVQKPSGGPMQNANIIFNNTVTQTDKNGRFNFRATDSNINASLTAVGFAKQDIVLNTNTTPVFKLDYKDSNLEEVVVTGYGNAKRKKEQSADVVAISKAELNKHKNIDLEKGLAGKIPGVQVKSGKDDFALRDSIFLKKSSIDAERERATFNNYVLQNMKPQFDEKGNQIKGKVVLSFTVNKKRKPTKVKIEQSLTTACDEQAIKLLENAPKWSIKKGMRETVTVNF
jgi:TonB family protein